MAPEVRRAGRRLKIRPLAAALLLSACLESRADPPREPELLLDSAAALAEGLERLPSASSATRVLAESSSRALLESVCLADFSSSMEAMLRHEDFPWFAFTRVEAYASKYADPLYSYMQCRFIVEKGADACGEFLAAGVPPSESHRYLVEACRSDFEMHYHAYRFAHAIITGGPELRQWCLESMIDDKEIKRGAAEQACDLLIAHRADPPEELARRMIPFTEPEELALMSLNIRMYLGDGRICGDFEPPFTQWSRIECLLYEKVKQAHLARSVEACGENAQCRALMGQGKTACDIPLGATRRLFCGRFSDPRYGRERLAKAIKSEAARLLDAAGARLKAFPAEASADRLRRLESLRRRLELLSSPYGGAE